MDERPGLLGRIVAHLQGEVAATALEAYRRAGAAVYEMEAVLEQLRLERKVDPSRGDDDAGVEPALLCGWNAFALQLLADEFVAADFVGDPLTVGYVEPAIAEQALAFYGQVPGWLSRAQRARHDPAYALDVSVPVPLPPWVDGAASDLYVVGLLQAMDRLRPHAEASLWDAAMPRTGERGRIERRIRNLLADAELGCDYAKGLRHAEGAARVELLAQARDAVERYYLVGQLVAMPRLALRPLPNPRGTVRPGRPRVLPPPGDDDFDPWCLTEQRAASSLRKNRRAVRQLTELWAADPDPVRTLAIRSQLDGAVMRGDIAYEPGHYIDCPWSPIYLVKRPIQLASRRLHPLEQCTYVVEVGGIPLRPHFRRRIVTGPFH